MKSVLAISLLVASSMVYAAFPTRVAMPSQEEAFDEVRSIASQIKRRSEVLKSVLESGPTSALRIVQTARDFYDKRQRLDELKATPGIVEYARSQLSDPTLDLAAEFTAMISAMDGFVSTVRTSIPEDASGYAQVVTVSGSGGQIIVTYRTFPPAQTTSLQTLLQTLIGTIQ